MDSEEAKKVRQALIKQIEGMDIPESQKQDTITKISQMPPNDLEKYLGPKCVFCGIASKQMQAFRLAENEEALVVLEINPMAKGHSMLIPKKHLALADFSPEIYDLLQQTIQVMKEKLNPVEINVSSNNIEGHTVINILPLSGKESGKREKANPEDLKKLEDMLRFQAKKPGEKEKKHKEEPKEEKKEAKAEEKEEGPEPKIIETDKSEPEIIIEKSPIRIP